MIRPSESNLFRNVVDEADPPALFAQSCLVMCVEHIQSLAGMAFPGTGMMAASPYGAMGYQMPYYHPSMMVQQFAATPYGFGYGFGYGQPAGQMQGQPQGAAGQQGPFPPAAAPAQGALPYDSSPHAPLGSGSGMSGPFGPGPGPGQGSMGGGSTSTVPRFPG